MMPIQFTVSAPGKVILNGEHSVVYNEPALAGVIGLRNYITLTEISDAAIKINLDVITDSKIVFDLAVVNRFLANVGEQFDMVNFLDISEESHDAYLNVVRSFVHTNVPEANSGNLEKALCAIIYLLIAIESSGEPKPELKTGIALDFKSGIKIGAGLGSSASYAVCLATAFYSYVLTRTTPTFITDFNQSLSEGEKTFFLNTISSWAFMSEKIMHGNPSGLDNTICTFGNVVQYTKKPQKIMNVALKSKLNILLVNSGVSRNTLQVVANVKELRGRHERLIDLIMNAMGVLVHDVVNILENDQPDVQIQNYEQLKQLFTINNNLLRAIDVSHPVLEEIFSISERNGFGCKLTGAGAGGYAIVLLPPDYLEQTNYKRMCAELTEKEFEWNITTIGGEGLKITQSN